MAPRPLLLSRRTLMRGAAAAAGAALLPVRAAWAGAAAWPPAPGSGRDRAPAVHPRADWAAGLPAAGPLEAEAPGDVRVLIVHHSASGNAYTAAEVPTLIRSFHAFHTGHRGWPDIAYNFLADRFGGLWEGRTGSLDRPVRPDATGGSQGFAQTVALIGDHRDEPPTPRALASLTELLAWLAGRYGIATGPDATARFVSRGSSRWPAGAEVTVPTIAGHRDLATTACPGEAAYQLVRDELPRAVAGRRQQAPGWR